MSNLHRLQWIDAMIRAGRYPNCRRIADKFEISARQAARDIEYLRDSLNAPIEYSAERNGYYYTNEAFVLPAVVVSEEERRTLATLAEQYVGLRSRTGTRLAEIFGRLAGPIRAGKELGPVLLEEALPVEDVETYQALRQAIDERRVVRLTYRDQAGERTERAFCPYKLYTRAHVYYLVGYCRLRNELRTLRLDRIESVALTDKVFEIVPYYHEWEYGEATPLNFADPYIATLRLGKPINLDVFPWRALAEAWKNRLSRWSVRWPKPRVDGRAAAALNVLGAAVAHGRPVGVALHWSGLSPLLASRARSPGAQTGLP